MRFYEGLPKGIAGFELSDNCLFCLVPSRIDFLSSTSEFRCEADIVFDVNVIFAPATVSCIQMQRVAYGEMLGFFQEARKSVELVRSESLRLLATAPRLSNSLFVAV